MQITDRHLRSVEISGNQKGWRIEKMGKVDLPEGIVENGLVQNAENFKGCIAQLREKSFPTPQKSPNVIVNIAEEHAFSRIVQLPPLKEEEIDEAIQWEAESNIPLPIDKAYLSWEILEELADKKKSVLLTAVPKNVIDNLLKNLLVCGLNPVAIEPESAALVRSLSQTQSFTTTETPLLIVNLREYLSQIIAFDAKVVALSTTTENASRGFDQAIESFFKISEGDAEKFRQKIGWDVNDELGKKLIEATEQCFSALKKNITSAISFFGNKTNKDVKKILLTGEKPSKWKDFDKYLEREIKTPTRWQNSWDYKIWPPQCPYVTEENEEYNIGIGLALRKLEEGF